jgi:HEAT repeat protein
MRKVLVLTVIALLVGSMAYAQGYIPTGDKDKRKAEEKALAEKLLKSPDPTERAKLRQEMVDKDAIRDNADKVLGDGFSVDAFVWLYEQGLKNQDVNARLQAVLGLASVKAATAIDPLIRTLDDPSPAIQLRTIETIRERSLSRAWNQLLPKLRSSNILVMEASAKALAALGQGGDTVVGPMLELLTQNYDALQNAQETERRAEFEDAIEVLGRSAAPFLGVQWGTASDMESLAREIAKLTSKWNEKRFADLKNPVYDKRMEALKAIGLTADKSVFFPVLEAMTKEFGNLQTAKDETEKAKAQAFLAEAGGILSKLSGKSITLRANSTTEEDQNAIKEFQAWWKEEMNRLALPK